MDDYRTQRLDPEEEPESTEEKHEEEALEVTPPPLPNDTSPEEAYSGEEGEAPPPLPEPEVVSPPPLPDEEEQLESPTVITPSAQSVGGGEAEVITPSGPSEEEPEISEIPSPFEDEGPAESEAPRSVQPTPISPEPVSPSRPSTPSAPSAPKKDKKNNTGLIIAIVVGVLLILCCCCLIVLALFYNTDLRYELGLWLSATLPLLL
ncbi:MAG: hypothetical protein ACP5HS_11250 [Anaerolineae bacterium]